MRFRKGQSGNPKGRPRGTRNKATLAAEALLDGEAQAITRKAVALAKSGDTTALRLCMERIVPVRRDRPVAFPIPDLKDANDAAALSRAIVAGVAAGDITPLEAGELAKLVDTYTRAVTAVEHEQRLKALEEQDERSR
jgi:hypothetical protein